MPAAVRQRSRRSRLFRALRGIRAAGERFISRLRGWAEKVGMCRREPLPVISGNSITHTIFMQYQKIYVGMLLHIDTDGNMKPVAIEWVNGVQYEITKIIDVRQVPPRHVGGLLTMRYTVMTFGQTRELYREHGGKWFVEKLV